MVNPHDHTYCNSNLSDHSYSKNQDHEENDYTTFIPQVENIPENTMEISDEELSEPNTDTCVLDPNGSDLLRSVSHLSNPMESIPNGEQTDTGIAKPVLGINIDTPNDTTSTVIGANQPLNKLSTDDPDNHENMDLGSADLGINSGISDDITLIVMGVNMPLDETPTDIQENITSGTAVSGINSSKDEHDSLDTIPDQDFTYDGDTNTSTDTIAYDVGTSDAEPTPDSTLEDLFLVRDRCSRPISCVNRLWENDAMTKNG